MKMRYFTMMMGERVADVYGGENCDQHIPQWKVYAEGDKDDETSKEPITVRPEHFPAGTRVIVEVPICPRCDQDAMLCQDDEECDFDWSQWAEERYS